MIKKNIWWIQEKRNPALLFGFSISLKSDSVLVQTGLKAPSWPKLGPEPQNSPWMQLNTTTFWGVIFFVFGILFLFFFFCNFLHLRFAE